MGDVEAHNNSLVSLLRDSHSFLLYTIRYYSATEMDNIGQNSKAEGTLHSAESSQLKEEIDVKVKVEVEAEIP